MRMTVYIQCCLWPLHAYTHPAFGKREVAAVHMQSGGRRNGTYTHSAIVLHGHHGMFFLSINELEATWHFVVVIAYRGLYVPCGMVIFLGHGQFQTDGTAFFGVGDQAVTLSDILIHQCGINVYL